MGIFSLGDSLTLGRRLFFPVGFPESDRGHLYLLGGTGTGKTSAMYTYVLEDMRADPPRGVGVIDVHQDLSRELEAATYHLLDEEEKKKRLVILDPTRGSFGFNPLEPPDSGETYPRVLSVIKTLKTIWEDSWGMRMEDILRNSCLALSEAGLTFCEIPKLLTDRDFRGRLVRTLENESVKEYWEDRFEPLPQREKRTWIESTLNKISVFTSDPYIRKVVGQSESTIDFKEMIDNPAGTILIISLPKSIMRQNVFLLGALFISRLQQAAVSRGQELGEPKKFHFYLDEVQNFVGSGSLNFAELLSESRKFGVALCLGHQDTSQLSHQLLASILGNTNAQVVFRISREDAETLGKEVFQVDTEEIEWCRDRGRSFLSLQESWEENFNEITSLPDRYAYTVVKGGRARRIRTVDKESFSVSRSELAEQAQNVMKPYTKTEEEIKTERERLRTKFDLDES